MLVRNLLVAFTLVSSSFVSADCSDDVQVEYGVYTAHLITDRSTVNEDNNFVSVNYNCWTVARLDNSYNDPTITLGYHFPLSGILPSVGTFSGDNLSVGFGLIHGYGENSKYFPSILQVGGDLELLWYVVPELTVWGSDFKIDHPWSDNVGVRTRLFGEVSQTSLVLRFSL